MPRRKKRWEEHETKFEVVKRAAARERRRRGKLKERRFRRALKHSRFRILALSNALSLSLSWPFLFFSAASLLAREPSSPARKQSNKSPLPSKTEKCESTIAVVE